MEKPTSTAIDYNLYENMVIEERIRNYYLPVKNVLETVRDRRINIPNSPRGLCVDLIEVSRTINIEFNLSNDGTYLWQEVINPGLLTKIWTYPCILWLFPSHNRKY